MVEVKDEMQRGGAFGRGVAEARQAGVEKKAGKERRSFYAERVENAREGSGRERNLTSKTLFPHWPHSSTLSVRVRKRN